MTRPGHIDNETAASVDAGSSNVESGTSEGSRVHAALEVAWHVALSILFVTIALGGFAAAAAVMPQSCALCHGDYVDSLAQTAHADVHCDACHVAPGPFGLVDNRLQVAAMVPAMVLSTNPPVMSIDNDSCLECHDSMIENTVEARGIRMNHRSPQDEGWLCTSCHPTVGHETGDVRSYGDYTMDTCLACHVQNASNVSGCDTCHSDSDDERRSDGVSTPWQVAHGVNWRTMHGMGDLDTCRACHGPGYCEACHVIEFPHPSGFLSRHGDTVMSSSTASAACSDCHDRAVCEGCHGVRMPHPVDFLPSHSELVETDGQDVCVRCHEQSNCDDCHERHAHPGLTPGILEQLRGRPVEVE